MPLSTETLMDLYRQMRRIRVFEEKLAELVNAGQLAGFLHLYAGQESAAVGGRAHLVDGDYVASTHRGDGHAIAKGVDLRAMMAELFGRRTGVCKGKGGSMHIADLERGMLGANGIVGAGIPLTVGAALTRRSSGRAGWRSRSSATAPPTRASSTRRSTWPRSGSSPRSSSARTTATARRPRWSS